MGKRLMRHSFTIALFFQSITRKMLDKNDQRFVCFVTKFHLMISFSQASNLHIERRYS